MTAVRNAAEFAAAINAGGNIEITGDILGVKQWDLRKPVTITCPANSFRLQGRIVFHTAATVDGRDPFTGLILDDSIGGGTGTSSWTITAGNVVIRNVEATNGHTAIGFNTYGTAPDLLIESCRIHGIGIMPPGNHDHGIYITDSKAVIRNCEIWDCADRGVQLRGSMGGTVENCFIHDNGEGVIFGDLQASNNTVRKSILTNNRVKTRYLIESYQPGTGNQVDDCYAFNADGRPPVQPGLTGVTITNLHKTDPQYDVATGKLKTGSPAVGYGPTWIQPTTTPPDPTPTNAQLRDEAVAHLKQTTVGYINKHWTTPPTGTHWADALDELAKIK